VAVGAAVNVTALSASAALLASRRIEEASPALIRIVLIVLALIIFLPLH
jgi:hypothetical protein